MGYLAGDILALQRLQLVAMITVGDFKHLTA